MCVCVRVCACLCMYIYVCARARCIQLDGVVVGRTPSPSPPSPPPPPTNSHTPNTPTQHRGYSQGLAWYAGQGGHRNPWALWRASRLNLHFVAPAHRVVLGDNAGANLRAALDGWCRGGIVLVDVPPVGGGTRVDFGAALKDVAARAAEGGYALVGLAAVCPEVQRMVLSTED